MRVCVTERREPAPGDLLPAGQLAPSLALPWVAKLRYGVLAGLTALVVVTHFVFHVRLPLIWLAIPLGIMAASNLFAGKLIDRLGVRPALGALLVLDTLSLSGLLALTGGPSNPFTLLYLVEIALSAVVLSKAWTWILGAVSVASFGLLFVAHVPMPAFEAHHGGGSFSAHLIGMWIAFAAGALLVTVFIGKVSEALRKREQDVLELREQLSRHERLSSIATLSAGAAHELGTPLGTIAVVSKDLEIYAAGNPDIAGDARLIRSEVERCSRILHRMSARSAEPLGESPAVVELSGLMESVRASFQPAERDAVRIELDGARARAHLPPEAMRQALTALVRNALDASPPGRPVILGAVLDGEKLRFTVRDFGAGMSRETLNRVAEPFFTTKEPGRGMGLGTFLVRVFAQNLNGGLSFESEPGAGSTAILEIPLNNGNGQREAAGIGG